MATGANRNALLSAEGLQVEGLESGPIDLTLRAGDRIGVVAKRADEASRLLQVLVRLQRPVAGHLMWQGTNVTRRPRWLLPRRLRDDVLLIWANPYALFNEEAGIRALLGNRRAESAVTAQIRGSGLSPGVLAFQVRSLSGLERVRLALAYAEKRRPQVILVDDVFSHLVPESWQALLADLDRVAGEHGALLITSRHLQVMEGMASVYTMPDVKSER